MLAHYFHVLLKGNTTTIIIITRVVIIIIYYPNSVCSKTACSWLRCLRSFSIVFCNPSLIVQISQLFMSLTSNLTLIHQACQSCVLYSFSILLKFILFSYFIMKAIYGRGCYWEVNGVCTWASGLVLGSLNEDNLVA